MWRVKWSGRLLNFAILKCSTCTYKKSHRVFFSQRLNYGRNMSYIYTYIIRRISDVARIYITVDFKIRRFVMFTAEFTRPIP